MSVRGKKIRPGSIQWFADALSHPALASMAKDIRFVCATADKLHRTASGVAADRTKRIFLSQLRKIILQSKKIGIGAATIRVEKNILWAKRALQSMDHTPALNPHDWEIDIPMARVKSSYLRITKARTLQGGAPQ